MNFIEKIIENFQPSFTWTGNKKKIVKQKDGVTQIHQEEKGVANVYNIGSLTVNSIESLAGLGILEDPDTLLKTGAQRFLAEQNIKQRNFKMAVEKAELNAIENPQELNQDWFLKWMDISQGVSRENVQKTLAKILSGEIKDPDSFSLRTLEILKNLSKEELEIFQKFCDISYSIPQFQDTLTCVISEPFGNAGSNGLLSLGLSYPNLTILQDAGLIQNDLNAWREFHTPAMWQFPFKIGSASFILKPTEETATSQSRVTIINFTRAGLELRKVLDIGSSKEYNDKFSEWVKNKTKMELAPADPSASV